MIPAKNYETLSKFVKVIRRIPVASFFSGHGENKPAYFCNNFVYCQSIFISLAIRGPNLTIGSGKFETAFD